MIRRAAVLALLPGLLLASQSFSVVLRGKTQNLARVEPVRRNASGAVLFLPGDGGWRGAAVKMAATIASWGYQVYGFDTKKYLEAWSHNDGGRALSGDNLRFDMRSLCEQVAAASSSPLLLLGWSQGAAMAVTAAAGLPNRSLVRGVVTLGMPRSAVLGWDWKATLAVLARREPDEPVFPVAPLLPQLAPVRVWMIYGSEDEYTQPGSARALFQAASEPKHLDQFAGANHRFDGHEDELYRSLKAGLEWIAAN